MLICIKFHHALCHRKSCYVIIINFMVQTCCVRKGGKIFNVTTLIKGYHVLSCLNFMVFVQ